MESRLKTIVVTPYVSPEGETRLQDVELPALETNYNAWQRAQVQVWAAINANLFALARALTPEPDHESEPMKHLREMAEAEKEKWPKLPSKLTSKRVEPV